MTLVWPKGRTEVYTVIDVDWLLHHKLCQHPPQQLHLLHLVLQESLCSLKFAAKVNGCETAAKGGAKRNVTQGAAVLASLVSCTTQ